MTEIEELKSLLNYNPCTGLFTYKITRGTRMKQGNPAGYSHPKGGYINITLKVNGKSKTYRAHRIAWLFVYGKWPEKELDHKDTYTGHNWISNLREATRQQNNRNKGVNKTSITGIKGVNPGKNGKFRSYICLGTFNTKEEAGEAYRLAAIKLHGDFAHNSLVSIDSDKDVA